MDPVYAILFGMALGFSLTIPPGPMNALIASESVRSLRSGVVTGAGAMSADIILGLTVYAIKSFVSIGPYAPILYIIGAVMVTYIGVSSLRNRKKRREERTDTVAYGKALAMGLTNPFQILWWLSAGLAFAYIGGALLFIALFAAVAIWIVVFPLGIHMGTRRSEKAAQAVTIISAGVMFAFAAYFAALAAGLL